MSRAKNVIDGLGPLAHYERTFWFVYSSAGNCFFSRSTIDMADSGLQSIDNSEVCTLYCFNAKSNLQYYALTFCYLCTEYSKIKYILLLLVISMQSHIFLFLIFGFLLVIFTNHNNLNQFFFACSAYFYKIRNVLQFAKIKKKKKCIT